MRTSCTALAIAAATILLYSCCNPAPTGPDIQVAGYFESAKDVAAVWKDSLAASGAPTVTKLYESGTENARAFSAFVSGTDVYVAGFFQNSAGNDASCYWKNGARTDLYSDTAGSFDARAAAVYVSGADVYVAGYVHEASRAAGYWLNGTWIPLDATAGEATDIVVSGTDVYVSGYVKPAGVENSCYWVNGTRQDLYTANYSVGYGIAVSGSDVYVAGYYFYPDPPTSSRNFAGYWKNATWFPLHDTSTAKAFDVVLSGADVYAAGYYDNGTSGSAACYWKNGVEAPLYDDAVNSAQANGIFVDGSGVYVAGWVNEGLKTACYWKNGVRTPLTSATSECYSLAIQD